jgi:hypothetical protein
VEEFDGDLRRHLFHRALHLLGSVCQSIGVDVDADPATPAAHVIAELQAPDRLLKLVPALWTLESDHKCVGCSQNRAVQRGYQDQRHQDDWNHDRGDEPRSHACTSQGNAQPALIPPLNPNCSFRQYDHLTRSVCRRPCNSYRDAAKNSFSRSLEVLYFDHISDWLLIDNYPILGRRFCAGTSAWLLSSCTARARIFGCEGP